MVSEGKIIVVSAPSGAGKTMLIDAARASIPDLVYSVSATTRRPRANEIDGVHYFFLSEETFKEKIKKGEFAEWQEVHGHYYGTPRRFIEQTIAAGKHIIMDIDVYGKKKFDEVFPQNVGILIVPPSWSVLEHRLRLRGSDDDETIRLRLANARIEMDFARRYGKYQYHVVNDDRSHAEREFVDVVRAIIATAPHAAPQGRLGRVVSSRIP